jgi:hypothetical protein
MCDPELASLADGTGGLITHVASDPAHQEQHCLRSGWAILQCRRARRQRDPLSCLESAEPPGVIAAAPAYPQSKLSPLLAEG